MPNQAQEHPSLDLLVGYYIMLHSLPAPMEVSPDGVFAKHYRSLTTSDVRRLSDTSIRMITAVLFDDRMDLLDRILPTDMDRAEFGHIALNEAARRNLLREEMLTIFTPLYAQNMAPGSAAELGRQRLNTAYPVETTSSNGNVRRGTLPALELGLNDIVTNVLSTGTDRPAISPQLATILYGDQPGATNQNLQNVTMHISSDMQAAVMGYMYGYMNQFNPSSPEALVPNGITFVEEDGVTVRTGASVQPQYCQIAREPFRNGNNLDTRTAVSMYAVQARADRVREATGYDVDFGLVADCPPATPTVPRSSTLNARLVPQ